MKNKFSLLLIIFSFYFCLGQIYFSAKTGQGLIEVEPIVFSLHVKKYDMVVALLYDFVLLSSF